MDLLQNGKPGSFLIDMTTSAPSLAMKILKLQRKKGFIRLMHLFPVGMSVLRKPSCRLWLAAKRRFEAIRPVLNLLGTNIVYQGTAGAGQHTKMCNQIAIASNMIGVCEAIIYAEKAGLNPESVLKSITTGAAGSWSLSNLAPRMLNGNFEPGFYIKHFIKDMKIALDEAEHMEMKVPGLALAKSFMINSLKWAKKIVAPKLFINIGSPDTEHRINSSWFQKLG